MFEKNVLISAIIILILLLAIIGYLLNDSIYSNKTWPPSIAVCPDYWEDKTGTGKFCENIRKLGRCHLDEKTYDFSKAIDPKLRCEASKDFKMCDITWDGITNDDNACSSPSDKSSDTSSSTNMRPIMIGITIITIIMILYLFQSNKVSSSSGVHVP